MCCLWLRSENKNISNSKNLQLLFTWLGFSLDLCWSSCCIWGTRTDRNTEWGRAGRGRGKEGGGGGGRWSSCTPGTPPCLRVDCHFSPPAAEYLQQYKLCDRVNMLRDLIFYHSRWENITHYFFLFGGLLYTFTSLWDVSYCQDHVKNVSVDTDDENYFITIPIFLNFSVFYSKVSMNI